MHRGLSFYGALFTSPSPLVGAVNVEFVECFDKREALEVGDRRLEPEEDMPVRFAVEVCLLSPFSSL